MNNNFENDVKQQLDLSVTTLDAMTQSQLTQARYKALEQAKTKDTHLSRWFTGLASATIVTLLVMTIMPTNQTSSIPIPAIASSPAWILVSDTSDMNDLELYQYLDFYQWVEDTEGSNS
ncbi:MAG TPA: hypothetical protein ENH74_00230 [Methylophaga sp.]|nr:hypothetical protein [Methylophaga sp.]HEC59975.1 hypothetical protein [Methylophaga sp.]